MDNRRGRTDAGTDDADEMRSLGKNMNLSGSEDDADDGDDGRYNDAGADDERRQDAEPDEEPRVRLRDIDPNEDLAPYIVIINPLVARKHPRLIPPPGVVFPTANTNQQSASGSNSPTSSRSSVSRSPSPVRIPVSSPVTTIVPNAIQPSKPVDNYDDQKRPQAPFLAATTESVKPSWRQTEPESKPSTDNKTKPTADNKPATIVDVAKPVVSEQPTPPAVIVPRYNIPSAPATTMPSTTIIDDRKDLELVLGSNPRLLVDGLLHRKTAVSMLDDRGTSRLTDIDRQRGTFETTGRLLNLPWLGSLSQTVDLLRTHQQTDLQRAADWNWPADRTKRLADVHAAQAASMAYSLLAKGGPPVPTDTVEYAAYQTLLTMARRIADSGPLAVVSSVPSVSSVSSVSSVPSVRPIVDIQRPAPPVVEPPQVPIVDSKPVPKPVAVIESTVVEPILSIRNPVVVDRPQNQIPIPVVSSVIVNNNSNRSAADAETSKAAVPDRSKLTEPPIIIADKPTMVSISVDGSPPSSVPAGPIKPPSKPAVVSVPVLVPVSQEPIVSNNSPTVLNNNPAVPNNGPVVRNNTDRRPSIPAGKPPSRLDLLKKTHRHTPPSRSASSERRRPAGSTDRNRPARPDRTVQPVRQTISQSTPIQAVPQQPQQPQKPQPSETNDEDEAGSASTEGSGDGTESTGVSSDGGESAGTGSGSSGGEDDHINADDGQTDPEDDYDDDDDLDDGATEEDEDPIPLPARIAADQRRWPQIDELTRTPQLVEQPQPISVPAVPVFRPVPSNNNPVLRNNVAGPLVALPPRHPNPNPVPTQLTAVRRPIGPTATTTKPNSLPVRPPSSVPRPAASTIPTTVVRPVGTSPPVLLQRHQPPPQPAGSSVYQHPQPITPVFRQQQQQQQQPMQPPHPSASSVDRQTLERIRKQDDLLARQGGALMSLGTQLQAVTEAITAAESRRIQDRRDADERDCRRSADDERRHRDMLALMSAASKPVVPPKPVESDWTPTKPAPSSSSSSSAYEPGASVVDNDSKTASVPAAAAGSAGQSDEDRAHGILEGIVRSMLTNAERYENDPEAEYIALSARAMQKRLQDMSGRNGSAAGSSSGSSSIPPHLLADLKAAQINEVMHHKREAWKCQQEYMQGQSDFVENQKSQALLVADIVQAVSNLARPYLKGIGFQNLPGALESVFNNPQVIRQLKRQFAMSSDSGYVRDPKSYVRDQCLLAVLKDVLNKPQQDVIAAGVAAAEAAARSHYTQPPRQNRNRSQPAGPMPQRRPSQPPASPNRPLTRVEQRALERAAKDADQKKSRSVVAEPTVVNIPTPKSMVSESPTTMVGKLTIPEAKQTISAAKPDVPESKPDQPKPIENNDDDELPAIGAVRELRLTDDERSRAQPSEPNPQIGQILGTVEGMARRMRSATTSRPNTDVARANTEMQEREAALRAELNAF